MRRIVGILAAIALPWIGPMAHAAESDPPVFTPETVRDFFENPPSYPPRIRSNPTETSLNKIEVHRAINQAVHYGDTAALKRHLQPVGYVGSKGEADLRRIAELTLNAFDTDGLLDWESLQSSLSDVEDSTDWYANAVTAMLRVSAHFRKREYLLASRELQYAIEITPNALTAETLDMHREVSKHAVRLHGVTGNPALMFEALKTTHRIETLPDSELTFNRPEALSNILNAANRRRDHELAGTVVDLLERELQSPWAHREMAQFNIAAFYNEAGEYEAARQLLERAIGSTADPIVTLNSKRELMIALAGLGEAKDARALMAEVDKAYVPGQSLTTDIREQTLHAESLLAAREGDGMKAAALMNRRLDRMLSKQFENSNRDVASMLANLENSRERQMERERTLAREAKMKAEKLKQSRRLNYLLIALLCFILSALFAAITFLRYRERVNATLHELNKQALSAEKAKTEFLGVINHELRTPLNGVIGISDAIVHHGPTDLVRRQAKTILKSGQSLMDLIQSMLDMTTLSSGKMELVPERVNPALIISEEAQSWADDIAERGVAFTTHIDPALNTDILADGERLGQCVRILLSNAAKFTAEGRVHLHATARAGSDEETLGIDVIVADTGQGMNETVQSRLFKPFLQADSTMTRKHGGAGLNLAIGRMLAEMMGGSLDMVSAEGRGSEFTLRFTCPRAAADMAVETNMGERDIDLIAEEAAAQSPQVASPAPHIEPEPEAPQTPVPELRPEPAPLFTPEPSSEPRLAQETGDVLDLMNNPDFTPVRDAAQSEEPAIDPDDLTGVRVLIVEDMGSNRDVIRLLLEPEGPICADAESGDAALALLAEQRFDVVLMDIRMPGLDGVETTHRLRSMAGPNQDVPVIALTADAAPETNARTLAAGADLFLAKPVIARELIDALRFVRAKSLAA